MADQTFPYALNIGYIGFKHYFEPDKLDKVLRSIIDLSAESSVYTRDEITDFYPHAGPLHFDFLPKPILFRYNSGIIVWEKIEKPLLLQSQGVLLDLGVYDTHSASTDGYHPFLVEAVKKNRFPTVYMVHSTKKQIKMELLKSKTGLEDSDVLMVYDKSNPDSLKEILRKLVEIIP